MKSPISLSISYRINKYGGKGQKCLKNVKIISNPKKGSNRYYTPCFTPILLIEYYL